MRERFRPEFLNRIDEIVVFRPLTREQIGEIVELQLARLRERLAERRLSLELTDEAKELIADAGWDPTYGARPLKRALQRLVENPLALRLLEGDFAEGDTVLVDARDGELVFERAPGGRTRRGLNRRLARAPFRLHHAGVWWRAEQVLDRETLDGIITMVMRIDANVQSLVDEQEDEDGEEEANA